MMCAHLSIALRPRRCEGRGVGADAPCAPPPAGVLPGQCRRSCTRHRRPASRPLQRLGCAVQSRPPPLPTTADAPSQCQVLRPTARHQSRRPGRQRPCLCLPPAAARVRRLCGGFGGAQDEVTGRETGCVDLVEGREKLFGLLQMGCEERGSGHLSPRRKRRLGGLCFVVLFPIFLIHIHDLNSVLSNLAFPCSGRYCRYSSRYSGPMAAL